MTLLELAKACNKLGHTYPHLRDIITEFYNLAEAMIDDGDPAWTYCDAERAIIVWVRDRGIEDTLTNIVDNLVEIRERALLKTLKDKYGDS